MNPGINAQMDGFEDGNDENEIIDEEELQKLREMKELKKDYRIVFKQLKELRQEAAFI